MAKQLNPWRSVSPTLMSDALKNSLYRDEAHFCDLIENNIELVCRNVFDCEYISHVREFEFQSVGNKKPAADFLIETDKGNILLECKVPKGRSQWSVSQLMRYIILAERNNVKVDRYVSFLTEYNPYDHQVIIRFNLPIEVYFITNETVFTVAKN